MPPIFHFNFWELDKSYSVISSILFDYDFFFMDIWIRWDIASPHLYGVFLSYVCTVPRQLWRLSFAKLWQQIFWTAPGTGDATKTDEFSRKVPKGGTVGGGHFQSKKLCCILWTFKEVFLSMKFEEKKLQHDFLKMRGGVKGGLDLFWKFIHFGGVTRPLGSPSNTTEPSL